MKLTLYKNCILSNSYNEVFYPYNLDTYLNTLQKTTIINDDLVYQTNSGKFNIELEYDESFSVYEYNYMKVETDFLIRYCFIDNIEIKNEIAIIYYSEDIWSSYSKSMQLRNGFLCRSSLKDLGITGVEEFSSAQIPFDYFGDSEPNIIKIGIGREGAGTYANKFLIIAQVQIYNADKYGEATKREARSVIIGSAYASNNKDDFTQIKYDFTIDEALKKISILVQNQSLECGYNNFYENPSYTRLALLYKGEHEEDNYHYQIDNITLLPCSMLNSSSVEGGNLYSKLVRNGSDDFTNSQHVFGAVQEQINSVRTGSLLFFNDIKRNQYKTIGSSGYDYEQADYKNISFGLLTSQFSTLNLGNSFSCSITFQASLWDFKLFIEYANQIIEITDSLIVEVPYEAILGEEQARRKLNRKLSNVNGVKNIVSGIGEIGSSVAGLLTGSKSLIGTTTKSIQKMNYSRIDRKITSSSKESLSSGEGLGSIIGGINSTINGIEDLVEANQQNYVSNFGTFATSEGVINAVNGLLLLRIIPTNSGYLYELIKRIGYIVYEPLNDLYELESGTWAIRFSSVDVHGYFPQSIANTLKNILLKGTIIRYS